MIPHKDFTLNFPLCLWVGVLTVIWHPFGCCPLGWVLCFLPGLAPSRRSNIYSWKSDRSRSKNQAKKKKIYFTFCFQMARPVISYESTSSRWRSESIEWRCRVWNAVAVSVCKRTKWRMAVHAVESKLVPVMDMIHAWHRIVNQNIIISAKSHFMSSWNV